MDKNEIEQAKALANRPYRIRVTLETMSDGEQVYVVSHPDLPGCMSHGATFHEAKANLSEAREEFVLSMIEDGVLVPDPTVQDTATANTGIDAVSSVTELSSNAPERPSEPELVTDPTSITVVA